MPIVDLRQNFNMRSELEFFDNAFFTVPAAAAWINLYIAKPKDRLSILASPILMNKNEAAQMPPTLITVSEVDILRSEGEAFAALLQDAGVDCALLRAQGQLHDSVFLEATRNGPTPKAEMMLAAEWLREGLGISDQVQDK
jgi:acetyl esterase/lipase